MTWTNPFWIFKKQGLQSRDRHLFLFNDLLLIAKARSGGHFKLKDKVRISELWLSTGIEEVAEGSAGKSRDTSFVIGWPPSVNLVATFRYINSFLLWKCRKHVTIWLLPHTLVLNKQPKKRGIEMYQISQVVKS